MPPPKWEEPPTPATAPQRCRWQKLTSPSPFWKKGAGAPPDLILTTEEGERFYLEDITYYPGKVQWGDLDDDDEWE
jgi:hypothetical protein